jgi:hypothetical protein
LRVGARNTSLDRELSRQGASHWAFVTAYNPYSRPRATWYNVARSEQLLRAVRASRWPYRHALAEGDSGDWPVEEGLLILGISPERSRRLGRRFHQNAVLVGELGRNAELLWCVPRMT